MGCPSLRSLPLGRAFSPIAPTTILGRALIGCGEELECLVGQWGSCACPCGVMVGT